MTQPLTLPEVRQLERLRADINKIGSDPAYQTMSLYINKGSRELWLNVIDLALEANEKKQEEWKHISRQERRAMGET